MINAKQTFTSQTTGTPIPVNLHGTGNIPIGIITLITGNGATGTIDIQGTVDDESAVAGGSATWYDLPNLNALTGDSANYTIFPWRFIRPKCSAYTTGTLIVQIVQGSLPV